MSEFELISLFNEFFDDTFSRLTDFMTGTFAMLISTFFVGARLSENMARLVVLLYTLFVLATAVPTLAALFWPQIRPRRPLHHRNLRRQGSCRRPNGWGPC